MTNEKKYKVLSNGNLNLGGADAVELSNRFGTPLYVLEESQIRKMCRAYKNGVSAYGESQVLYASKALACKAMYKIISSEGLGCDVVSEGELLTALSAGVKSESIYFHGNNKSLHELELAVDNNVGIIVADSFVELDNLDKLCAKKNKKQCILLRVNVGIEAHTHSFIQTAKTDSKFGFSISNGDAEKFFVDALSKKNLVLKGFHSHIGSQIFEIESFNKSLEILAQFMSDVNKRFGFITDILDIGGGIGVHYSDDDADFDFNDYTKFVEEMCEHLKTELASLNVKKPKLVIEPGRSIVAKSGTTLYTVGGVKEIEGIRNYLSVDGGMFENPRCALYGAKYEATFAARPNEQGAKSFTIAGKCCESGDMITRDCYLPQPIIGEILAVFATGAYNYSMASNYNRNAIPAMVLVSEEGNANIIIKRQTVEQILQNDVVPTYLEK